MNEIVQNMFDVSSNEGFFFPEMEYLCEWEYSYQVDEKSKSIESQEDITTDKEALRTIDISDFVSI